MKDMKKKCKFNWFNFRQKKENKNRKLIIFTISTLYEP
jgi:hypothetical protein